MPRIVYKTKKFRAEALNVITVANQICNEYAQQGYDITLRQLYYQFVARGFIANKQSEYKRLGSIINDARMAGYIDWDHLVDRTRNPVKPPMWDSPEAIVEAVAEQFRIDKWATQSNYVEVWVEKEALAGVISQAGRETQVTTLACRGYMSQSEQWAAAQRFDAAIRAGRQPHIIHLGDHDPSGLDMTRDNDDRLRLFTVIDGYHAMDNKPETTTFSAINGAMLTEWGAGYPIVNRIALNWDQIEEYNPPPNPAKDTDARFEGYRDQYGDESWELDALPPDVLHDLIVNAVEELRDDDLWDVEVAKEKEMRKQLAWVSDNWDEVTDLVPEEDEDDD